MGADIIINVTVGIVSRGNEPFLEECLRALTAQGLDGLEVIVADISDEGGRENWLASRFEKQKCLYRHLPRCAAGAAKNYLLETAAGEYVAFLGEDICYLPGGLEKLYAQAKESGADMIVGRAAAGNFGGKEYPAAWTVDGALVPQKEPFAAEDIGERALLLCKGWSGDKLFRTAYLRENGLRFSEGAFPSAGVVFGVLACGKTAVSREAVLRTQDEDCVKYRKNPMKSATDVYLAMLSAEEALKRSGKAEALKKIVSHVVYRICGMGVPKERREKERNARNHPGKDRAVAENHGTRRERLSDAQALFQILRTMFRGRRKHFGTAI